MLMHDESSCIRVVVCYTALRDAKSIRTLRRHHESVRLRAVAI
jgi:hypothetical protein